MLTQEDWNEVLYNGMEKTSAWAALYFIALMTFGNYVLFNLLVAILVEGFSTEVETFFWTSIENKFGFICRKEVVLRILEVAPIDCLGQIHSR